MTTPSLCAYGVIRLGSCVARMDLCIYPGFAFDASIQLKDPTGAPMNWPTGTTARMRVITDGTGSEVLIFDSEPITDSWLSFILTGADTLLIPQRAELFIDLNYDSGAWRPWALGRRGAGVCR
jgi:hypothetical protein